MGLYTLLQKYDSAVNEKSIALIPACEADILYVIGLRDEINEVINAAEQSQVGPYIEKLDEIDERLKNIAKLTIVDTFKLPDGVRTENWWTNLDTIH